MSSGADRRSSTARSKRVRALASSCSNLACSVYGTVVGSKSYETQIGGETYVPEIDAQILEE
jgi:hypothetical protein